MAKSLRARQPAYPASHLHQHGCDFAERASTMATCPFHPALIPLHFLPSERLICHLIRMCAPEGPQMWGSMGLTNGDGAISRDARNPSTTHAAAS